MLQLGRCIGSNAGILFWDARCSVVVSAGQQVFVSTGGLVGNALTWAPKRASDSLRIPPPQPTSSIERPVKGLGWCRSMLLVEHTAALMKSTLTMLNACSGAKGPSVDHHWSARAANLEASL